MSALMHDPTFWTAIAFVIFVVALFKPVKKALLGGLDGRIAQIRSEVEEAQRLRKAEEKGKSRAKEEDPQIRHQTNR